MFKSTSDPSPARRAPFVCRALWGFDSNFMPVNARGGSYRCSSAGSEDCVMLVAADKTLFLALIASDRWQMLLRQTSYTLSPGQLYCPQWCTSAYTSQCVFKAFTWAFYGGCIIYNNKEISLFGEMDFKLTRTQSSSPNCLILYITVQTDTETTTGMPVKSSVHNFEWYRNRQNMERKTYCKWHK